MVFLGLEKPVEYGAQQIFDPTMANMVLQAQQQYNEAARKEYERGLEDFDKFTTKYGDFISPFVKDMARYGQMVGNIRNTINQAYADGVDLLRSPEGRMLVHRLTNSIDPKEFNMMRANAKLGYAYLDALKDLTAKGKSSKELEDYVASLPGNVAFDQFSTEEHGAWNRMPTEYSTLQQFVHPSFANLKPHLLTKQEAMSRVGAEYDPRADYKGITKADMEASMRDALPGLTGNALYGFYRDQAKKQLIAAGIANPTEEQINEQFVQNAVTADHQMMMPLDKDYERYYKDQNLRLQQASHQLARDKFDWDKAMDMLQLGYDPDGNPISSSSSAGGGYGNNASNLPTKGTATMVSYDQDKQYNAVREQFEKDLKTKEASAFSNLDGDLKLRIGDKQRAYRYKKAQAVLSNPKSSDADIKSAKETIEKIEKSPSAKLKSWIDAYKNSIDSTAWDKYRSSTAAETEWGKEQPETSLMSKAHEAFYRQNILSNPLDIGARGDMNHALGIVEEEGKKIGTVTKGTEFAPVSEAAFTGNRRYRYSSKISKLNNLLKGKHYTVTSETESGREYGSGEINNTKYDVVTQKVIFDDPSIVEELDNWSAIEKQQAGITKLNDNEYEIPIITKFSRGSYTWANVNSETDRRYKESETARQRPSRLAEYVPKRIQ